jgi:hypothetical protein
MPTIDGATDRVALEQCKVAQLLKWVDSPPVLKDVVTLADDAPDAG